jgi:hypothetical protein
MDKPTIDEQEQKVNEWLEKIGFNNAEVLVSQPCEYADRNKKFIVKQKEECEDCKKKECECSDSDDEKKECECSDDDEED